jgi:hypothetical protein
MRVAQHHLRDCERRRVPLPLFWLQDFGLFAAFRRATPTAAPLSGGRCCAPLVVLVKNLFLIELVIVFVEIIYIEVTCIFDRVSMTFKSPHSTRHRRQRQHHHVHNCKAVLRSQKGEYYRKILRKNRKIPYSFRKYIFDIFENCMELKIRVIF